MSPNVDSTLHKDWNGSIHDWNASWYYANVNCKIELLTQNILKVYNAYVPLETKLIKKSKPPWFRKEIKFAIKTMDKLYS